MKVQQLIAEIAALPEPAREELEQFLLHIKQRYSSLAIPPTEAVDKWKSPEFYGAWGSADGQVDSIELVRRLRQNQWRSE